MTMIQIVRTQQLQRIGALTRRSSKAENIRIAI